MPLMVSMFDSRVHLSGQSSRHLLLMRERCERGDNLSLLQEEPREATKLAYGGWI